MPDGTHEQAETAISAALEKSKARLSKDPSSAFEASDLMDDLSLDWASRALRAAIEAGEQVGLDTSDAKVLRVRSSVHVDLPRAGVVARIEGPGDEEIAHRQVDVASVGQRGLHNCL